MQDQEQPFIHQPHDKGYKYLLSSKRIFIELLRSFVNQGWVSEVDEEQITAVDKSYILPDFSEKEADLVYRLQFQDHEIIFYVLMELQSTVDFHMPYRLLQYQMEIWRDVMKNDAAAMKGRKDFRLPAIIPIVIYNGEGSWTAKQSFRQTIGRDELFGPHIVDFEYILLDVQRYLEADLLSLSSVMAAVFLLEQKADMELLNIRLRKLANAMEAMADSDLQRFLTWLVHKLARKLPIQVEEEVANIVTEIKNKGVVNVLSNLDKTLDEIENKAIQHGFERGIEQGIEQGIERGIEQGKGLGIVQGLKRGKIEMVSAMLVKGLDVHLISELSGLTLEEVNKLKHTLN